MHRRRFLKYSLPVVSAGLAFPRLLFADKVGKIAGDWHVEQFFDKGLAQYSYAVLFDGKIILVDPARETSPYYAYAELQHAKIVGVVETHLHADFISSHTEIGRKTGATIYVSGKANAKYIHHKLQEGDVLRLNEALQLKILDTPGHSPDSVSLLLSENNTDKVIFTGDALLFGDVGRPDLREYGHNENEQRTFLARESYHTVKEKFSVLHDDIVVYPAHGAGSLCGNATHNVTSSTIGYERANNHAFHHATEDDFVKSLLKSLPFVPQYFPYDVELNRSGPQDVENNAGKIKFLPRNQVISKESLVIDIRPRKVFVNAYFPGALNVPDGLKFETWFGTVVPPSKKFYLIAEDEKTLHTAITKLSKIGYETNVEGVFVYDSPIALPPFLNGKEFVVADQDLYTIIDVRSAAEYEGGKLISSSINIPLPALARGLETIPRDKPIVVHCASGYRSAIASSILRNAYPDLQILDLGEAVTQLNSKNSK